MDSLLSIGLENAVIAGVLALLVSAVALGCRKPALLHALWVLVLLKLVTPPIWNVSVNRFWARAISHVVASGEKRAQPVDARAAEVSAKAAGEERGDEGSREAFAPIVPFDVESPQPAVGPELPRVEVQAPSDTGVGTGAAMRAGDGAAESVMWRAVWMEWIAFGAILVWVMGSGICLLVIVIRILRFQRLLRFATLAEPELQIRTAVLAQRMDLARVPGVWFVPGAVCPMLWAVGRSSRLLVPRGLWDRLDLAQRSSLLAHELAHLRRRDHWVRLLELLASVLYWWCPVTWYARGRLRESEEQCCDAWVVWAFPGSSRHYASALLEAVDFVTAGKAGGQGAGSALPMLASGMGQFHQLQRRLIMIKNARVSKSLSRGGWAAVCALAAALLPFSPTRAQDDSAPGAGLSGITAAPPTPAKPEAPDEPGASSASAGPLEPIPAPPAPARAALAPVAGGPGVVTARPDRVAAETATATSAAGGYSVIGSLKSKSADKDADEFSPDGAKNKGDLEAKLSASRAEVRELQKQLEKAQRRQMDLEMETAKWRAERAAYPAGKGGNGAVGGPYTAGDATPRKPREARTPLAGTRLGDNLKLNSNFNRDYSRDADKREKRLEQLEQNLQAMLDEVRSMKKDHPEPQDQDRPRSNKKELPK